MPIYAIALIGVVVTFAPLTVMVLLQEELRPRKRLWKGLSVTVFCGVMMVLGGIFAAGLVTTPTTPRSEFGAWWFY